MIESKETLTGDIVSKQTIKGTSNIATIKVYPALEDLTIDPKETEQVFTHKNSYGYDKVTVNAMPKPNLQDKEVTPTKGTQTITSDAEYEGLNKVTVKPIPDSYTETSGTLTITENGEHNVKEYEKVVADVHEPTPYAPRQISFAGYKGTELDEEMANLDTSNVTTMTQMFNSCSKLVNLDTSKFNTTNVTTMASMFYGCNALLEVDVSNFNTSNVTTMANMFSSCYKLNGLDVSNFDTQNVTSMQSMFSYCNALTSLDVSNFNTTKVTTMRDMFSCCYVLTSLDVSNFDTSKVTDMYEMFYNCRVLTELDLRNWNTSKVTTTNYMFATCPQLTKIILGGTNVLKMSNSNMFSGSAVQKGTGYVYVPDDLVDSYKTATNWSTYAAQIKGISELV